MKKIILAMVFALTSMTAFAYNTEYAKLIPGKKIFIDSANKNVISLVLDTKSKNPNAVPEFSLVNQWSGFECEYKQTLLLFSGFNATTKEHKRTWEIQVTYVPGADLSGCILNVSFPGLADSKAEIFMNY